MPNEILPIEYVNQSCQRCAYPRLRKICEVGEREREGSGYYYDIEWLCQCDQCNRITTVFV